MKQKEKSIKWRENLKESLLKSIIYRIITITLGISVIYIITGSIIAALSLGIITEIVQFINYFIYESVWTHFHDKRLKRKLEEMREVDVKFDFDLIKDLSYEFSQTSTFVKEHYESIIKLLDNLLRNDYLEKIHDVILRDKTYFEIKHKDRTFHKL